MTFKERLAEIAPRDLSGSRSSDRFVYQQTWALCRLLSLHQEQGDYVMTFDHHEDVTILDSENDPTSMSGFQIKTSKDNWTLGRLLKRPAGAGKSPTLLPSIIGKLYDLKIRFPDEVTELVFVSNTCVTVHLKATGKKATDQKQTAFDALDAADQKLIRDALKAEAILKNDPPLSGLLEFTKSDLPIEGHDTHGRGKLAEFLNALFPSKQFQVHVLFGALLSEVAVRNNNQDPISGFEDLLRHKSLSRKRFTQILEQAGVSDKCVDWSEVSQRLNTEQVSVSYLQGVRKQWDSVTIDRLARRDVPFTRLWNSVDDGCTRYKDKPTLLEMTEAALPEILPKLRKEWGFSLNYVRTCLIVKRYELEQFEAIGPGAEEEEPQ